MSSVLAITAASTAEEAMTSKTSFFLAGTSRRDDETTSKRTPHRHSKSKKKNDMLHITARPHVEDDILAAKKEFADLKEFLGYRLVNFQSFRLPVSRKNV